MFRPIQTLLVFFLFAGTYALANPNYYANIGMSKPFAPEVFQEDWRAGFNIGTGIGYNFSPKFEIQGELLYDNFQLDDNSFLNGITDANDFYASVSGGTTSLIGLYANFKYLSPLKNKATLTPYIVGSLGIVNKSIAEFKVTTEEEMYTIPKESQTIPAAGMGLGVEFVMGKSTSFVVEGRFNVLLTDETTVYFPLKLGIVIR